MGVVQLVSKSTYRQTVLTMNDNEHPQRWARNRNILPILQTIKTRELISLNLILIPPFINYSTSVAQLTEYAALI